MLTKQLLSTCTLSTLFFNYPLPSAPSTLYPPPWFIYRKRSTSKTSAGSGTAAAATVSASKTSLYEHTSSPSVLTFEALEEMGIGMLDSEESSSSAMSAIALAVSATSDENSNETTPCTNAPRMTHQQTRMSLNSTTSTLDSSSTTSTTTFRIFTDDPHERFLINQSAEKLGLLPAKHNALSSTECSSNSNSPSKRTRNPLATVSCNSQSETMSQMALLPPPPQHQTPLSLLPSTSKQALLRQQRKPTPVPILRASDQDNFFVYRLPMMKAHISSGINYFDRLSDEILLNIFKWLPKKTLLRIASVCRRFNCCARDETLWTRLDLGLRTLSPRSLEKVVRRGVPVLRLAQAIVSVQAMLSQIFMLLNPNHYLLQIKDPAFIAGPPYIEQTRLQYLDLSLASISQRALYILFSQCRQLRKLSLEHIEVNDTICFEISQNTLLETLNLSMASGLTDVGVRQMLSSLTKLNSLNISWTDLSGEAVTALVTHTPSNLIRLNIAGCRRVLFDSRKEQQLDIFVSI